MFERVLRDSMSKSIKKRSAGFTLTEVVVASSLLIVAMVPILKGLTSVHYTASLVKQRTDSLNHAQTVLEDIKARSIYDFDGSFNEISEDIGSSYLYTSTGVAVGSNLKQITVTVGHDKDDNGNLQSTEVLVTLDTLVAKRW